MSFTKSLLHRCLRFASFLLILATLLATRTAMAAADYEGKPPRVAEVEEKLSQDALAYVKARFPAAPVLIAITVDPLRRDRPAKTNDNQLPLFPGDNSFEIRDEWDDPGLSILELFPRIRRATVKVTLPASVSDSEITELRDGLYASLHLIPGRDSIDFERKQWDKDTTTPRLWELAGQGAAGLLFLVLLYLSLRGASQRIAAAVRAGGGNSAGAGVAMAPSPAPSAPQPPLSGPSQGIGGEVRFSDPIQIRAALQSMIAELGQVEVFPTLRDMVMFQRLAVEDLPLLRAFVGELPIELRQRLFPYGTGKTWLDAFVEPGDLTVECFQLYVRILKTRPLVAERAWEDLLIAVWRTDAFLPEIMRQVPQDAAISVLQDMPTEVAVPMGRQAFPGSWGVLLQNDHRQPRCDSDQATRMLGLALTVVPWLEWADVEGYRHQKGLLDYLRTATYEQEREVYEASDPKAKIHTLRPPFFRLFSAPDETLAMIVRNRTINDLALALFNVTRADRRRIETLLTEKQRFLLIEQLKVLDRGTPDKRQVGLLREAIGRELQQTWLVLDAAPANVTDEDSLPLPGRAEPAKGRKAKKKKQELDDVA